MGHGVRSGVSEDFLTVCWAVRAGGEEETDREMGGDPAGETEATCTEIPSGGSKASMVSGQHSLSTGSATPT